METKKVSVDDLRTCQRCGRLFIEKEHKVCKRCVEELEHNLDVEEENKKVS